MENQVNTGVIKTADWIVTILILAIPLVNLIMLFIWAFGSNTNPNKANFAKAALIWLAIGLVVSVVFSLIFGASMFAFL